MVASLVTAAALGVAGSFQEDAAARESLLHAAPKGTLLAVACDDVRGFIAGLRAGPFGALWDDAALQPLRARLEAALADLRAEAHLPSGPPVAELIAGMQGFALFLGDLAGEGPAVGALALSVSDELAPALAQALAHAGARDELVQHDGLEYQVRSDDAGDWLVTGEWSQGLVLAFGEERERALDWGRTVVEALEADPRAPTARAKGIAPTGWPALELHVHVGDLFRSAAAADAQEQRILAELGVLEMPWAWAAITATPTGSFAVHSTLDVADSGWLGTWTRRILSRPAPIALGDWAPADAIEASFLALDAGATFDSVADLVARTGVVAAGEDQPPVAEILRQRIDEFGVLIGVELREALLENLTGDFARFVLSAEKAYAHAPTAPLGAVDAFLALSSGALPQVGAVHVVGLRDGNALEDVIDGLIAFAGADGLRVEEQVGEHWMQSLEIPGLPFAGIRPSWAVLDDALLVSGGPSSLRAVLGQLAQDAPRSWLDVESNAARARALLAPAASAVSIADSASLFERRVLRPLREVDAALDDASYGGMLQAWLAEIAPAALQADAGKPLDELRGYLRQGLAAGERLRDGALRGVWTTTLACVDSLVVYRSWSEPARRD